VKERAQSFDQAAAEYERGRPGYPAAILDVLPLGADAEVIDLAAGTGKLTRVLVERYRTVFAVEPLDAMRAILAEHIGADRALAGRAEELPLPDASVDGAVCSDAWHWFDGARAADELARVIRPGGGVVICVSHPRWYGSDDAPDWWLDLGVVHAALPKGDHPALVSGWRRPDIFEGHPAFEEMERHEESFVHHTDREGIVAHWASMSFVAALPEGQRADFLGQLDGMLARRAVDAVDIPYRAQLWVTRRRLDRARHADPRAAAS
jgi:SAM-dependent methyltransferase